MVRADAVEKTYDEQQCKHKVIRVWEQRYVVTMLIIKHVLARPYIPGDETRIHDI